GMIRPALRELASEDDVRRRKLETLPALISSKGRATEGEKNFAAGKGACSSCHRIRNAGNSVGPNLSTIGQIRTERDLLESILFPSATIARDFWFAIPVRARRRAPREGCKPRAPSACPTPYASRRAAHTRRRRCGVRFHRRRGASGPGHRAHSKSRPCADD